MNGWLIYDDAQFAANQWFAEQLLRAGSSFSSFTLISAQELAFGLSGEKILFFLRGEQVSPPNFAVVRTIFPLLSEMLEKAGVRVFNRAEIARICNDKRLTYAAMLSARVPVLPTAFCDRRFFDIRTIAAFDYPLVLKSASGHGGTEVFLLKTEKELLTAVSALSADAFLLQKLLEPSGRDLRVYVLGGRILGAVMRSSDGFRSNHSLGGKVAPYRLDAAETQLVQRVLAALPCQPDFVGVDLLPAENGYWFNEIEDVVGCRMLYETSDILAADVYMNYIGAEMEAACKAHNAP